MKITTLWTYRLKDSNSRFGISLQVYSEKQHKWTHLAFCDPAALETAAARYRETMRYAEFSDHYAEFSFNNLLELAQIVNGTPHKGVELMLKAVQNILRIELEVL